ncbi:Tn3 family transposase [Nocardia sp. NPDC049707]|uniref:Tn3 family transposase n=1 Tax=Nocardia sp. NPDC049707 TaxID=3154735 RepID=UPI00341BF7B6
MARGSFLFRRLLLHRPVLHFVPCGAWEAVHIIDGLLRNDSDAQPDTIYADTAPN